MVAGAKLKGTETPEKLIKQMADYSRAGDSTNLLNCFDTSTKVHEIGAKSFAISIEIVKAKADLRDALVKKFGAEEVAALKANYLPTEGEDPLKKLGDSFQNPTVTVEGDTAKATFGGDSEVPLRMEKKNNRWLLVRELQGMAVEDEEEAFDRMEANRYYVLGLRDALKAVPNIKTVKDVDKQITSAINQQIGTYLSRPAPEPESKK